jgi:hypothetical protein
VCVVSDVARGPAGDGELREAALTRALAPIWSSDSLSTEVMSAFFDAYDPVTVAFLITNSNLPFGPVLLEAGPFSVLLEAPLEYVVMMSGSAALPFERELHLPRPLPVDFTFWNPVSDTTAASRRCNRMIST